MSEEDKKKEKDDDKNVIEKTGEILGDTTKTVVEAPFKIIGGLF